MKPPANLQNFFGFPTLHFRLLEPSAAGNGTTFKLQSLSSCASRRGPDEEIIRPRHDIGIFHLS